jgi:ABC-type dipeptide/oligopeptide/nickel transport system permease component
MAYLLVTSVLIIVANLVADILYGYLDPRIRLN